MKSPRRPPPQPSACGISPKSSVVLDWEGSGVSDEMHNRFDLDKVRIDTGEMWAVAPKKIKRRRRQSPSCREYGRKGSPRLDISPLTGLRFTFSCGTGKAAASPLRYPTGRWRWRVWGAAPNGGRCGNWNSLGLSGSSGASASRRGSPPYTQPPTLRKHETQMCNRLASVGLIS